MGMFDEFGLDGLGCSSGGAGGCASCGGCSAGGAFDDVFIDEWVPSLCPVCFKSVLARKHMKRGDIHIEKACPEHGYFDTVLWRGAKHYLDFGRNAQHAGRNLEAPQPQAPCPGSCGLCSEHEGDSCIAVIEVTKRCNLSCPICFADAGAQGAADVPLETLRAMITEAVMKPVVPTVQLSGGEPSLHPDIIEVVAYAKYAGVRHLMLNTNGIRLAEDPQFAIALMEAGLDAVYLQFDALDDTVYRALRGCDLLVVKEQAIKHCAEAGLAVVLVPTMVAGVNADKVGELIDFAREHMPTVKGVHFQPASFFGRVEGELCEHGGADRATLSDVIAGIEEHVGPSGAGAILPRKKFDAHCSFSASYLVADDGSLVAHAAQEPCCGADAGQGVPPARTPSASVDGRDVFASETADYLSDHWRAVPADGQGGGRKAVDVKGTEIAQRLLDRTLTLSGMHFQDADTLDLTRTKGCCVHVIDEQCNSVPLCIYYLTSRDGQRWDYAQGA